MTTSSPRVDPRSNPTLDCFTEAVILREGPAAVGSTYLRGSSSTASATPASVPTPTSVDPSRPSYGSPRFERMSAFRAAPPVLVIRPGPATARAQRASGLRGLDVPRHGLSGQRTDLDAHPREVERGAAHAGSLAMVLCGAFATGAATDALADAACEGASLEVAVLAAVLAGVVIMAVAVSRMRAARRAAKRTR